MRSGTDNRKLATRICLQFKVAIKTTSVCKIQADRRYLFSVICQFHNTFFPDSCGSTFPTDALAMLAKYWMTFLVFSVFPAPDSPLRKGGIVHVNIHIFLISTFSILPRATHQPHTHSRIYKR